VTDGTLEVARRWIAKSSRILVVTGAGISTDSGIPDYRGPQGVWTKSPGAEKAATLQNYLSDPELRKQSWRSRLTSPIWSAQPNAGHLALVELERQGKLLGLVTQNVDGLHHDAGHDPSLIIEIHGTARRVMCWSCGDRAPMEKTLARVEAGEVDPACRTCGGILKSDTISFGQQLVMEDLARAELLARECELLLAVGSTLAVYPAAGVVPIARAAGAKLVIVNGSETEFDWAADAVVRGSISDVLPKLVAA
jgi:NAD-dependent deacetylase